MSLDFRFTNMVDREKHFPPDKAGKMNDTLHVLIFATMAVDLGDITESNYLEACDRYNRWVMMVGPQFRLHDKETDEWMPFIPTVHDWKNAIGLSTNVINTSRRDWNRRLNETIERQEARKS